ncbi:MAG: hypothetical protein ACTS6P_02230, partial [Candidatus Hodgkinia cicadicola]
RPRDKRNGRGFAVEADRCDGRKLTSLARLPCQRSWGISVGTLLTQVQTKRSESLLTWFCEFNAEVIAIGGANESEMCDERV